MSEAYQYTLKYQQLLRDLKSTVEGLLMTQVANVWSVFGGLNRFHNIVDKIFKHGCKSSEMPGYFKFIQGLEWLQPEHTKSYFSIDCEYRPHIPCHLKSDKSAIWLYRSLENHSLSQKLSWLLSDKTHLSNCYQSYAFLCQEKFAEATLICLRAVERNQASLMSDINPYLFLQKPEEFLKVHRRSASFPDNRMQKIYTEKLNVRKKPLLSVNDESIQSKHLVGVQSKIKTWHSMPNLLEQHTLPKKRPCSESKTNPNTPIHAKKLSSPIPKIYSNYRSLQPRMRKKRSMQAVLPKPSEVKHVLIDNLNIVEHTPSLSSSQSSGTTLINDELVASSVSMPEKRSKSALNSSHATLSVVDSFLPMPGEKDYKKLPKKTFIEDGGMSVLPPATGYFPKPSKGQSLLSFLTYSHFARANAELDRENAHFSVSEAIISAMEQIRCKKRFNIVEEQLDDSDPEIVDLKQKIRLRRNKRMLEKQKKAVAFSLLSDGKTDTATTVSPCSTSFSDTGGSSSSDGIEDLEINEPSNLEENAGLSMSMASLYSEADLIKRNARGAPDGASDILSAEGVALSLISKFSEKQLPRASDLEWLVSEEETHQTLLPLPKSWPVSPDSAEDQITPLRGTQDWAPPRPQLIFTLHPIPIRKELIAKQNYRCAGCSMRVAPKYASKFRYCEYLGRFFCTGCHKNQLSLIPGRVLQKWDFKRYPVSTFSYKLLEQMYIDPLFRIFSLNKNIGKMAKNLELCNRIRLGLHYLKDFIFTCKYTETIREKLDKEMGSALMEPEVYSMDDLFKIRNGDMVTKLKNLVEICCKHTSECKLCLGRGFICECCSADDIIFPWQLRTVSRCQKCGSCYHVKCWRPELAPCKKCSRIQKRKESIDSSSRL